MKHEEGSFKGVRDTDICYQCWLPEGEPSAALLIVHGLAEHCGRYTNVVNHFVPLGYAVYGIDHIGHGKSGGTRVYVRQFADFIDVLKVYLDMIHDWQPGRPIFMVGHSLGALIGAVYALDHQADLAGAILSGPLVKVPDNISPLTVLLSRILSVVMARLGVASVDAQGVSRDPAVVDAYVNDPLVYTGKTTARLGCELLKAMRRVKRRTLAAPTLVPHGSEDQLVPLEGAAKLHRAVGSIGKTLRMCSGLHHEPCNEPEDVTILRDVKSWIEERLARGCDPNARPSFASRMLLPFVDAWPGWRHSRRQRRRKRWFHGVNHGKRKGFCGVRLPPCGSSRSPRSLSRRPGRTAASTARQAMSP